MSHGIFNEIYYPRVDQACTRDFGLLVTSGGSFFSEEKRHATHSITALAPGVPGFRLENTCTQGRYRLEKEVLTDPLRETVLQQTRFVPLKGSLEEYHLYALLAPHIGNRGEGNTGWVGEYKGMPMLFAERQGICLAVASSAPWIKRSVGFVGFSDAWQDISLHRRMTWSYRRAENGNVALAGEVDLRASNGEFVIAVGFGRNDAEAGNRALASLSDGFEHAKRRYITEWQEWQKGLLELEGNGSPDLYRASTAVMRVHEAKNFPGGLIASLSIPWGFAKGDDDLGGYHLVWPRDLAEAAGGLLAAGANEYAGTVLGYLQSTQEPDGHWPQNMWLDGTPYWNGIQMDETAFPILLVNLGLREKALDLEARSGLWPMVRRASEFIVQNGPVTPQDRWEEDPGYSPFTLAVQIAALVCAADLAEENGEPAAAAYLRETADAWNDNIESWTHVTGTDLAREIGVKGYYVRIAPPEVSEASSPARRIHQAAPLPAGRQGVRHSAPGRRALPGGKALFPSLDLALQPKMPRDDCRQDLTRRIVGTRPRSLEPRRLGSSARPADAIDRTRGARCRSADCGPCTGNKGTIYAALAEMRSLGRDGFLRDNPLKRLLRLCQFTLLAI